MKIKIKEDLLHLLWKLKKIDASSLETTDGQEIDILSFGHHNHDAGPDFLEGRISIDGITWVGHVEMHLLSSDWKKHNHNSDKAYDNVILHVVYREDEKIRNTKGQIIPCIELADRINKNTIENYQSLLDTQSWISCEKHIHHISSLKKSMTIDKMMAERLTEKSDALRAYQAENKIHLTSLIYHRIAYTLGLRVNGDVMLRLAQSTPLEFLLKHRDQLFQLEAILFGQSGLLENEEGEYPQSLQKEYQVLQQKYRLIPMRKVEWKFAKLRPASFPTIRVAQLAKLIHTHSRLDNVVLSGDTEAIHKALDIKVDQFWKYHYSWNSSSTPRKKSLGNSKRNSILINAVVPILWMIGEDRDDTSLKEKAISILESLPKEKNSITAKWEQLGMPHVNAADSQGLLQLKKHYCANKRCTSCLIGVDILSA